MKPLILTVDCRMIEHSGIGTYLQNLLEHLSRSPDLSLICLGNRKVIESFSWSSSVRIISCAAPVFSIREQFELPLKIPPCDLFWSPQYNIPIFPIRAKKRVVTIHDVYHMAYFHTLTIAEKLYVTVMLNAAAWLSDAVITVSEFSKSEILRHLRLDERKIHVIYNGVKTFPAPASLPQTDIPYILFVGNVKPHKNLKNAIAAFAKIRSEYPELFFLIVGEKENLRSSDTGLSDVLTALEPHIRFTGKVDDPTLSGYYKNAAMLVFPSYYEGFGLPILEAMQFGIPIAASNAASIPEIGGEAVVYFDPFTVNDIANAIRQILHGDHADKPAMYPSRLRSFNWNASAQIHLKLFEAIIHENPSA